jgi:hypothetical protein
MIEELERLARVATHPGGHWWHTETLESVLVQHEAAFVSALSPDRVLRLLEVVKQAKEQLRLRDERVHIATTAASAATRTEELMSNGDATEKAWAALRAALAGLEEGQ